MTLANKNTQRLSSQELPNRLAQARGDQELDLLITNIQLLDVITGEIYPTCIAIGGEHIVGVGLEYADSKTRRTFDGQGAFVTPGFIDGHLHIESSMMSPFEFERATLPLGTTTAICDPHEITNVTGANGFEWFLRCAELTRQNLFVQMSSCVPALPGFETNGSDFTLDEMVKLKDHPAVLGLAEMMNFPGVINANTEVLSKIEAFDDLNLDGHAPLLRGKALNAYLLAGIQNCHETVTLEEGREKLQKGMGLIIREGSVAKNLKTLAPLVNDFSSPQCLLCTDDRNPFEIAHEGHINFLIKELINHHGVAVHVAYRLATYSAAKHFGLKRLGLVAPGKKADLVILKDLKSVDIQDVLIGGQFVSEIDLKSESANNLQLSQPPMMNTIKREAMKAADFGYPTQAGLYNVIEIVPNEIITKHITTFFDGKNFAQDDVLFMANIERYGKNLKPGLGFVKGMGLTSGALASSVAHDSHNIMVIGTNTEDMAVAVNEIIAMGGGFVVANQGEVKARVELPIAGLLSLKSADEIKSGIENLKTEFKKLGVVLEEPFIQMAFLALPVIPALKLTDKGLVDVTRFEFIELAVR
ncbi:adenine deaminase [Bdellovibrio svalbardensis]|uniref:Adenine deaminase n=1 Tax=Bdellovibrio svalbardensis TaxID=2972972 RepID=A0ABT6DME8_9BACT|nr:adenine deaminase [Bdellovibrio svalbardensis]MDG0817821.1 adenine deaminase [Bdellovibrio svalbardensis]